MKTKHNFKVNKNGRVTNLSDLGVVVTYFRIGSPSPRAVLTEVNNMPGALIESVTQDIRDVNLGIQTYNKTDEELDELRHIIYNLFYHDQSYSIIRDLNDTEIHVLQVDAFAPERFTADTESYDINLKMIDPFIYKNTKQLNLQDVSIVENEGSETTYPTIELTAKKSSTFAMINNANDEYMLLGQPTDVDEVVVNERNLLLSEYGNTLSSWTATNKGVDKRPDAGGSGKIAGSLNYDGTGLVVGSYGTGTNWHGPAVTKAITATQDFEIEMMLRAKTNKPGETFRIEFYMLDEAMNVIGKMAVLNSSQNAVNFKAEARVGDFEGHRKGYHIDARNYTKRESHFHGMLRVKRIGRKFEFYVARTGASSGGKHFDTLTKTFNDALGLYQGKLRYIQIHIGKYGTSANPSLPRINSLRVYRHNKVLIDQTPYIVSKDDVIEIDHEKESVFINGENAMPIKNFGAEFFGLHKGFNNLTITPENAFTSKVKYREKYK